MRNHLKTIESLRRLAERPGTPEEGATARRKLRDMEARHAVKPPIIRKMIFFDSTQFPVGTRVYYNKWAYARNSSGIVSGRGLVINKGEFWMTVKFDHLKKARQVPIMSDKGCHLSTEPLSVSDAAYLVFPDGVPLWGGWGE